MKAELEQKLTELTLEEKSEVVSFLMPFVTPPDADGAVAPELLAELDRRLESHRKDPSGAITLEEFKQRRFGSK